MNIKRSFLALILWLFYHLQETSCFVDPITGSMVVIGAGILYGVKHFYSDSCDKQECCNNEKWILKDMNGKNNNFVYFILNHVCFFYNINYYYFNFQLYKTE